MKFNSHALTRRAALAASAVAIAVGVVACAQLPAPAVAAAPTTPAAADRYPPIVFVHGNGDTAALWMTTIWRFESNGWPRERLHAIDLPYPLARDLDDMVQAGRTSTTEHRLFLAAEIDRMLIRTGANQVVLLGNSRGGNAIRSFIAQGGAGKVSHVVLGGTPNHGVQANAAVRPMNEFNGAGPFLTALNNQGAPGVEITPGPKWQTVRSDSNDKFAQPDGAWLGTPGQATNVTVAGPELAGAQNIVLPGIDHRETSYSPLAFQAAYRFITGQAAARKQVQPEATVVLDGQVSGQGLGNDPSKGAFPTNLPLAGATVEVYATDPATGERLGAARWRKTVGSDGRWGPFAADGASTFEFAISAPGYAVLHVYRSPFARSSDLVHFRADRVAAADKDAGVIVSLSRPRGYFGLRRDRVMLDDQDPAPGIPRGVAGVAVSKLKLPAGPQRAVAGQFNDERIVGRTWPVADNHLVLLELQY
jgi:pimeloyl-ACP methyl ester carboxylesterase